MSKTSVQLPPYLFRDMEPFPGLTKSEAIRLSVERAHYLACVHSEAIADLAATYEPVLLQALADFDYGDFRTISRALPAIVDGYLTEKQMGSMQLKRGNGEELDLGELVEKLKELDAAGRIGLLDCIVAQRRRADVERSKDEAAGSKKKR